MLAAVSASPTFAERPTFDEFGDNNTWETANFLSPAEISNGAISPIGDKDFYAINGSSTGTGTWGFIALLNTNGATGLLKAFGANGTPLLASDVGSWELGSGIALQAFPNGSDTHYLSVEEQGNNSQIEAYSLRFYRTKVSTKPEVEPNGLLTNATPSSFTHLGIISNAADRDCYMIDGRQYDTLLIALDGDPDKDGSNMNAVLELVNPAGVIIKSVDVSGVGGNEFLEYGELPANGIYAYCVRTSSYTAGKNETYKVGIVRNDGLYLPNYSAAVTWLNAPANQQARTGDILQFELKVVNGSPVPIPGKIDVSAEFNASCLRFTQAFPATTTSTSNTVSWKDQKTSGLAAGETYSVRFEAMALRTCNGSVTENYNMEYYATNDFASGFYATGTDGNVYLPMVRRNSP